ncbi:unnamed protein product [Penicillium olsonii]|nr:unnamed protein product [Penicillium olsonii]
MSVDRSPALRTSRKHLRSSDDDNSYDWSSDSSGQFDDAEEVDPEDYRSPAGNLAKRRRSNDWPLPEEAADYGSNDRRNQRSETGHLSVGSIGTPSRISPRASPRASPRGSLASLRARHAAASSSSPRHRRGRTSRFVEATMSDSVSEKPPSIYFRDRESKPAGNQNRSSGIFRFGKAIASAFNPFGGWNKSEGSPSKSPQKDVINQAEEAYAELKKAGYKGTNKGHYIQTHGVDCISADQTWQSLHERMEHSSPLKGSQRYSVDRGDRDVHSRSDSGASKRSSLQDLRLPMSLFHKSHESPSASQATIYCDRTSEESETGLRKQPSRKELSRQTKLLKKVSNLEDKLDRARRELRELTGNEPPPALAPIPPPNTVNTEIDPASFPRKFVPGALPTLPSERLLHQQAAEVSASGANLGNFTALPPMEDRESFSFEEIRPAPSPAAAKHTKRRSKETWPPTLGKDSLSRKRKSPIPEPIDSRKPPQPSSTDCIDNLEQDPEFEDLIDFGLLSPPSKTKWHKSGAGESPGSAKRRQAANQSISTESDAKPAEGSANTRTRRSSYTSSPQKPSATAYSPSPQPTTPRGSLLRRSDSIRGMKSSPPFISEGPVDTWSSPMAQDQSHGDFYLHSQPHLDPDRSPHTPSRSKTSPARSTRYRRDEDIPPVPPLPEELRSSAAKVHVSKSLNKSPKKRPISAPVFSPTPAPASTMVPGVEDYQWPDDIF